MAKLTPYKGYTAALDIDIAAGVLGGTVIGLRDVIHFEGNTVRDAEQAFHDSVDEYLEWCRELGEAPEKPYSGKVVIRMDPDLHRRLAQRAENNAISINSLVIRAVERTLSEDKDAESATAPEPNELEHVI